MFVLNYIRSYHALLLSFFPLLQIGVSNVTLSPSPAGFEKYYRSVLTPEAVKFVALLSQKFQEDVESVSPDIEI